MEACFPPGSDLAGRDLRNADLRGETLFACDLRGAQLYNAAITLTCSTFDGVKLDDLQVGMLLRLLALADIDPKWIKGLNGLVEGMVGERRNQAFSRYLQTHVKTI